jgi:hypothetical protein
MIVIIMNMFEDIFTRMDPNWQQTFFQYTYSANYKCTYPHCPFYYREINGSHLTTSTRFPTSRGVSDLNQNLENETTNNILAGRYRCEECDTQIRRENIVTFNSIELPCILVIELKTFHANNRRDITRNKIPIKSTVILGNRDYKLIGAAYYGNSHYASLRIHSTDNTIYENDGMIKDGIDRATRLTSMPYSFDFRQDVQRPATYEVEVAFYVLQPDIYQAI